MSVQEGPPPSVCLPPARLSSRMHPPRCHVDQAHGRSMSPQQRRSCCAKVDSFYISARWNDVTLEAAETGSNMTSLHRSHHAVGGYLFRVFTMQSSIEHLGKKSHFRLLLLYFWSFWGIQLAKYVSSTLTVTGLFSIQLFHHLIIKS